tara:strand:- start:28 stop:462 length:435 start_codon:yes stop_codon:yes gene_type:complete
MKPLFQTWQFWAIMAASFAALTAVLAKAGLDDLNSDYATFLRTIVILVFLGGILFATGQWQSLAGTSQKSILLIIGSGIATGLSWLCYFRALKIGDASRVAPVDKLSVVLVAIFGTLFLGERLSGLNWFGILLIFAGVMLVAFR